MGANFPYIPQFILNFVDWINDSKMTDAEKKLAEATTGLEGKMQVDMRGATEQSVAMMKVPAGESHFLTMQTQMLAAQHPEKPLKALDIGTFTGASAGAMAKGMGKAGGVVITCDVNEKWKETAEQYWKNEGVSDRIERRIAPAGETLQNLIEQGEKEVGTYDIAFIDANKQGYDDYYEKALQLVRPGGLVILDNMLWSGHVAWADDQNKDTSALRELNNKISNDERVDHFLMEGNDGIMIVKKRDPDRFQDMIKKRGDAPLLQEADQKKAFSLG